MMETVWLVNKVVTDEATYSVSMTVGVCTSEEKANEIAIRLMEEYPDDAFFVTLSIPVDTVFVDLTE